MLHKQINWPVCICKRTMVGHDGINGKKQERKRNWKEHPLLKKREREQSGNT